MPNPAANLRRAGIGLAISVAMTVPAGAQTSTQDLPGPPPKLSDDARERALRAATGDLQPVRSLMDLMPERARERPRVVVTNVEAAEAPGAETTTAGEQGARRALVTIYNYAEDTTIRRLVNLKTGEFRERRLPNATPTFTDVEIRYAKELVRENSAVRERLDTRMESVTLEFLPLTSAGSDDPAHGKRALGVIFKTSKGYLSQFNSVVVNLTDGDVYVNGE